MPLQAKHIVEEISGTRCTIVEKGATAQRVEFLKKLLTFNGFEVMTTEEKKEDESSPVTFAIGVTDLVFNPVISVYEMSLNTPSGERVSPAYWDQTKTEIVDQYWVRDEEIKDGTSAWHRRFE
ncbi:MAG: hypothetical protein IPN08_07880 [Bacteroidales bacterium]|nr:hypothetical protein [Bacteroidales bacterium]MBK9357289.1 hypothetical protein [Bacteroidales bacterium]